jgi:hypothetical protein
MLFVASRRTDCAVRPPALTAVPLRRPVSAWSCIGKLASRRLVFWDAAEPEPVRASVVICPRTDRHCGLPIQRRRFPNADHQPLLRQIRDTSLRVHPRHGLEEEPVTELGTVAVRVEQRVRRYAATDSASGAAAFPRDERFAAALRAPAYAHCPHGVQSAPAERSRLQIWTPGRDGESAPQTSRDFSAGCRLGGFWGPDQRACRTAKGRGGDIAENDRYRVAVQDCEASATRAGRRCASARPRRVLRPVRSASSRSR